MCLHFKDTDLQEMWHFSIGINASPFHLDILTISDSSACLCQFDMVHALETLDSIFKWSLFLLMCILKCSWDHMSDVNFKSIIFYYYCYKNELILMMKLIKMKIGVLVLTQK